MKTCLFICCLFSISYAVAQNVGIGTSTPSEKLEVNGNVKAVNVIATNSIQLTNGAAAGKVLTSNAAGVGSWVTPTGGGGTGTISTANSLAGFAGSSLPVVSGPFEFFGPTTTVTLTGNQRVVMNMAASLGKTAAGTDFFSLDIGYQLQPAGPINNGNGGNFIEYQPVFTGPAYTPYSIVASFKPAAGTYKIGCIISGNITGFLNNNNWVNGYYMIINE
jgi:hypothetical protein